MADQNKDVDPKVLAEYNELLKNSNDTLTDMLGISEKLNMSWNNRLQRQGQLSASLNKSRTEEFEAQNGLGKYFGIREVEQKNIVSSIKQRIKAEEQEMALLKYMNESIFAPFLYIAQQTWKLFLDMDKAVTVFNKTMGMLRQNTKTIQWDAQAITISLMDMGVTIEGVYKSAIELSHAYGSIYITSEDLVKTTALLSAQLGVAEEISAGFFKNMAVLSGTTMESQKSMAYMAGALSNAAGTNLSQVMGDIASKSSNTLSLMSRIPSIAIKSAIEFRRLGTSMDSVSDASRHILNFTESVQEEMEASVLLGHSINLQKARELAYHRNLEESNREILRLTKQNRFNQLDVFQQEAFAKATGRSVSELMNMVQADKEWNNARLNGTNEVKNQIKAYTQLKEANDNVLKDKTKQFELDLQTKSNQERIVAIQQKWNQLVAQLGLVFLPFIDGVLSIVPAIIPMIPMFLATVSLISRISSGLENARWATIETGKELSIMWKYISRIEITISNVVGWFKKLSIISKIGGWISKLVEYMKPLFTLFTGSSKFATFFGAFSKILGPIGLVITAIQFIIDLFGRWKTIWNDPNMNFGTKILMGLLAIGESLYHVLIDPFVKAAKWIWDKLCGKSPSQLGLSIVKGIVSVGSMLYDALTYPFRHVFAWILDHIPGMSKFAAGLRAGTGGIATTINHSIDTLTSAPQKTQEQAITEVKQQTDNSKEQVNQNEDSNKLLQQVIGAINDLRKDLNDGKIGVNIDSQRLSSIMSRNLQFSGNYGTNH